MGMALLVFFSTLSFTIEKHYCGNTLVDISVFTEVRKCAMEDLEKELEALTKRSCCKDTVDFVQGQDELNVKSLEDMTYDQQIFALSFVYTYINLFEGLPQQIVPHKDYSPPNLIIDLQVVDQVFLI